MNFKLLIISILLTACVNNNKPSDSIKQQSTCSSFKLRLAGSDVSLSYTKKLDFGPIYVGDTAYASLTFNSNSKEFVATNISGQIRSSQFSFGGTFPGINPAHGGCSTSLKSNKFCNINLQFIPSIDVPYSADLILTYKVNNSRCKQVIDLRGVGTNRY